MGKLTEAEFLEDARRFEADARRAAEIAEEIAGPLAGALPILMGLVSIVHGYTHGKDAMDDWADRLGKFTSIYPVVHEDAEDADLDLLVKTANEVNKAWAAAEPRIKTRAIQLLVWAGALQMLDEAYGPDAVEAFVQMSKGWAAIWDSNARKN